MAGFKTHISTSSILGIGYATGGAVLCDAPLPACVLAGGLCSVSGMLPDLDSGPGVPLRESVAFAAAVVPMLLIHRFRALGMAPESMVLAGGAIYLMIRFGVAKLFTRWTVHRGMFHSIPALAVVTELTYLICDHENPWMRVYLAGAVGVGFASHLVLDEIWSVDFRRLRLKSSFGTALKLWGECWWANLVVYGNVLLLTLAIFQDPDAGLPAAPGHEPQTVAKQSVETDLK